MRTTLQLMKILVKTQSSLDSVFKESMINLVTRCESLIIKDPLKQLITRLVHENEELKTDIKDILLIQQDHDVDMQYFKSQN